MISQLRNLTANFIHILCEFQEIGRQLLPGSGVRVRDVSCFPAAAAASMDFDDPLMSSGESLTKMTSHQWCINKESVEETLLQKSVKGLFTLMQDIHKQKYLSACECMQTRATGLSISFWLILLFDQPTLSPTLTVHPHLFFFGVNFLFTLLSLFFPADQSPCIRMKGEVKYRLENKWMVEEGDASSRCAPYDAVFWYCMRVCARSDGVPYARMKEEKNECLNINSISCSLHSRNSWIREKVGAAKRANESLFARRSPARSKA